MKRPSPVNPRNPKGRKAVFRTARGIATKNYGQGISLVEILPSAEELDAKYADLDRRLNNVVRFRGKSDG